MIDNLKCERTTFVSHLECSRSSKHHEAPGLLEFVSGRDAFVGEIQFAGNQEGYHEK